MDQTATTPETEVEAQIQGYTEAEAVRQLLGKWQKPEEPEKPTEQTVEPEQAAADATEPTEDAPETTPEDADFELDVGGAKWKFPKTFEEPLRAVSAKVKEIEAGATRKFQEAAELRKATETERAAVTELRQIAVKNADLLADHRTIARRMQALENIDINATDAETLARYNAEYTQLSAAERRITAAYHDNVKAMRDEEAKALRARQEHAERIVAQRIKGWGPETQKELAEYAIARGAPVEALNGITEPWMVEILADAAYGRKMRDHKSTIEKRVVQTTPTLKPGASTGQPRAEVKARDAMQRLTKTGKTDDAVAALLARSRLRN